MCIITFRIVLGNGGVGEACLFGMYFACTLIFLFVDLYFLILRSETIYHFDLSKSSECSFLLDRDLRLFTM